MNADLDLRFETLLSMDVEPVGHWLYDLMPTHWHAVPQELHRAFLTQLASSLPRTRLLEQARVLSALSMVHGLSWWKDPQFQVLAHRLAGAETGNALISDLADLYRCLA